MLAEGGLIQKTVSHTPFVVTIRRQVETELSN